MLKVIKMENSPKTETGSQHWCLVTVKPWKRDSFVRCLNHELEQKQLSEIILEIIEPEESVYENMMIIRVSSYPKAREILPTIEYFQGVQRLKQQEAERMLNH